MLVQVVREGIMVKTVQTPAPVGKKVSVILQLGGASVALVGLEHLVVKVRQKLRLVFFCHII